MGLCSPLQVLVPNVLLGDWFPLSVRGTDVRSHREPGAGCAGQPLLFRAGCLRGFYVHIVVGCANELPMKPLLTDRI